MSVVYVITPGGYVVESSTTGASWVHHQSFDSFDEAKSCADALAAGNRFLYVRVVDTEEDYQ